jgi:Uma2 family endonuclease
VGAQSLDELFAGHAGPWTEQEWAVLPESMGRVELLDGALVVSPFPAVSHQRLVRNLVRALEEAAPVDFEVFDGLNIRVGRDRIMIPDIVVLNEPGLDAVIVEPDPVVLVVEVTSPSTAWVDRLVKPDAYASAGIPYFLRVDPAAPAPNQRRPAIRWPRMDSSYRPGPPEASTHWRSPSRQS